MKCKDYYWYSDFPVKCCERDGSDPCDPDAEACAEFDPNGNVDCGMTTNWRLLGDL